MKYLPINSLFCLLTLTYFKQIFDLDRQAESGKYFIVTCLCQTFFPAMSFVNIVFTA